MFDYQITQMITATQNATGMAAYLSQYKMVFIADPLFIIEMTFKFIYKLGPFVLFWWLIGFMERPGKAPGRSKRRLTGDDYSGDYRGPKSQWRD